MNKTLLLDIDNTIMDGDFTRPYLKEFIEQIKKLYHVGIYTGGTRLRVKDALIVLKNFGFDREFIRSVEIRSLCYNNCPMIELKRGIEMKCLAQASEVLGVPKDSLILFDDAPSYDHPDKDQIIQAEGWTSYDNDDDYLTRVLFK